MGTLGVLAALKAFEELVAVFQVGTNRTGVKTTGHLPEPAELEKAALVEAGMLDLMRRAGFESREVQPIPSSPIELSTIAKSAAGPISEALEHNFFALVADWAEAAVRFELVVPPSVLIRLLELPEKNRRKVEGVLGERGRWLAGLMGIELHDEPVPVPPGEVRKKLEEDWTNLDWKERAEGVQSLAAGLSLADEPFLTAALGDKRKEVRETALELLLKLEESAIVREIERHAKGRLSVERKLLSKSLIVDLPNPEDLPKWLPKTPSRANLGPKALALFDLVRRTRPPFWSSQTGHPPDQLIALGEKSEHGLALIAGWAEAALRFHDQGWIDALFQSANMTPHQGLFGELLRRISEPLFESHIRNSGHSEGALTAALLREGNLSPALSRLLADIGRVSANWEHRQLATQLHVSALPFLEKSWEGPRDTIREHWRIYLDLKRRLDESLITR